MIQNTAKEKKLLKKLKFKSKDSHFHNVPLRHISVYDKLIIYLKKNKEFDKTTYSLKCWQHEIPELINNFKIINSRNKQMESIVLKYSWNGKEYKPDEIPFYGFIL